MTYKIMVFNELFFYSLVANIFMQNVNFLLKFLMSLMFN